jgi:hypothetical protein
VSATEAVDWALWNARVLGIFGPVLILTGIGGFVIPARYALMSGAPAYNLFHIACGLLGTALALGTSPRAIAVFNLGFGLGDLYQALAGVIGIFPARQFRYKTADHVVHLVLGLGLAAIGALGLREP